jgi:hypothetical protein
MTATLQRVADLRLRGSAGPTRTRVYWPVAPSDAVRTGLLLFFCGAEAPWLRELASAAQLVIVAAPCADDPDALVSARRRDAATALEWAADHAHQLEADRTRLLVGGISLGAALAEEASREAVAAGWPPLTRRVLVPLGAPPVDQHPGAAPATIVTAGADDAWPAGPGDAELRYETLDAASLASDLARTLGACGS